MNPPASPKLAVETAPFPKETIGQAVSEGKALIRDGKTKVDAATAMFKTLTLAVDQEKARRWIVLLLNGDWNDVGRPGRRCRPRFPGWCLCDAHLGCRLDAKNDDRFSFLFNSFFRDEQYDSLEPFSDWILPGPDRLTVIRSRDRTGVERTICRFGTLGWSEWP